MQVAIFTDDDVLTGSDDTLEARALRHAPPDMRLRIYATAPIECADAGCFTVRSVGPIPPFAKYADEARRSGVEIVHLASAGPVALSGLYVAWRLRTPVVANIGAALHVPTWWLRRQCSRVIVQPGPDWDRLIRAGFSSHELVSCAPGVEAELFSPVLRSEHLRATWHAAAHRPALVFVGADLEACAINFLAKLRDALYRRRVEHVLVLAGHERPAAHLRERLGDAVFTGALSAEGLAQVLATADIGLLPAAASAARLLSAQSAGLPVVVSQRRNAREHVVDAMPGTSCVVEDPDAWAEEISRLVRHQDRRNAMRAAARSYAAARSWSFNLRPLFDTYRELRGGASTAQPKSMSTDAMATGR